MAEKRDYTMTPAARAQRKGAPWKNGLHASGVLAQVMPPCMRSKCPLGSDQYPCEIRQAAEADGRNLERCPVVLGEDMESLHRLRDAILDGNIEHLAEGTALSMRLAHTILDRGLLEILRDGLTIEEPIVYQGSVVHGVVKHHTHPSAKPVVDLLTALGATADQQRVTPKSQGERRVEESFATLADRMAERRKHLDGSGS